VGSAGVDRNRQATLHRRRHVAVVGWLIALRQAAQVDAEGEKAIERGAAGKIFASHPVDIGEIEGLIAQHLVDVP